MKRLPRIWLLGPLVSKQPGKHYAHLLATQSQDQVICYLHPSLTQSSATCTVLKFAKTHDLIFFLKQNRGKLIELIHKKLDALIFVTSLCRLQPWTARTLQACGSGQTGKGKLALGSLAILQWKKRMFLQLLCKMFKCLAFWLRGQTQSLMIWRKYPFPKQGSYLK